MLFKFFITFTASILLCDSYTTAQRFHYYTDIDRLNYQTLAYKTNERSNYDETLSDRAFGRPMLVRRSAYSELEITPNIPQDSGYEIRQNTHLRKVPIERAFGRPLPIFESSIASEDVSKHRRIASNDRAFVRPLPIYKRSITIPNERERRETSNLLKTEVDFDAAQMPKHRIQVEDLSMYPRLRPINSNNHLSKEESFKYPDRIQVEELSENQRVRLPKPSVHLCKEDSFKYPDRVQVEDLSDSQRQRPAKPSVYLRREELN